LRQSEHEVQARTREADRFKQEGNLAMSDRNYPGVAHVFVCCGLFLSLSLPALLLMFEVVLLHDCHCQWLSCFLVLNCQLIPQVISHLLLYVIGLPFLTFPLPFVCRRCGCLQQGHSAEGRLGCILLQSVRLLPSSFPLLLPSLLSLCALSVFSFFLQAAFSRSVSIFFVLYFFSLYLSWLILCL
jgi:hypothetical protein